MHNEEIEDVLGRINNISSKAKRIVLKNNKIKTRYYAIDQSTQRLTHSNAQLTAEAVRGLRPYGDFKPDDIECMICGTSTPDLLLPGHSLMVLGELGITECDAVSTAGICISGMTALKYGFLNIAAGDSMNAVATGTELASSFFRANFFTPQPNVDDHIDKKPLLAFDADFLRWMLSDGAGAVAISAAPGPAREAASNLSGGDGVSSAQVCERLGDMDDDGEASVGDAIRILRIVVGLDEDDVCEHGSGRTIGLDGLDGRERFVFGPRESRSDRSPSSSRNPTIIRGTSAASVRPSPRARW